MGLTGFLVRDTDAWTTTLLDYYALPRSFPGIGQAFHAALKGHSRFIPFLVLHEFGAWVFAASKVVADHFGKSGLEDRVEQVARLFRTVEDINHGAATHPSKRLETMIPEYKKSIDGPVILEKAGLAHLRGRCPHLNAWVTRLESLT